MRALDLFCCGGGASKGLTDAGFTVTGVDIDPQPHYPYEFVQSDALVLDPDWVAGFDVIWASPPCQRYTAGAKQAGTADQWPDLVAPTRAMLLSSGRPFVIENVPAAPLRRDLLLCGSMFGLRLVRHRIFETHGFVVPQPEHGEHHPNFITVTGNSGGTSNRIRNNPSGGPQRMAGVAEWRDVMGIDWLPASRLREAIPPVYAEHIGLAALSALTEARAA